MAFSVNEVRLLGNLGKDAEIKFTPSGAQVATFSVATERSWKDKSTDEWKKETQWTNCVLWGKEKVADQLKKGTKVHVSGRLQTRNYEDKDGKKVYVTEVVADDAIVLNGQDNRAAASVDGGFEPF
jgi:single-strand DNA-binding protein